MIRALHFTETDTGTTYTASVSIPEGGRLLDLLIETTVAWTAATAPCDVGDSDGADSLASATNVDLAAQQGIVADSQGGTDWGNGLTDSDGPYSASGPGKLYPNGDTITAVVSPTVPGGPTGISAIYLWIEPAPSVSRNAVVV